MSALPVCLNVALTLSDANSRRPEKFFEEVYRDLYATNKDLLIVAIYRRRWQIESFFKQIKQNFHLRNFYGESANAIKIQIWVTLIANLLLPVLQCSLKRRWSFFGLATIVRIMLMYYINLEKFLNQPDADLKAMLAEASESPPVP